MGAVKLYYNKILQLLILFNQVIITLPSVGVAEYCDNCVCLLVCPRAYLWNWMSDLHELFCACYLLLWLFPHLALWCFCISCLMDEHRGCYGSHTRPVVREFCKVTIKVNRKGGNLTPRHPKTPQTMVTKICVGDYVGDIYQHAKFHPNRFSVSVLHMRDFAPIGTKWLGSFLGGFLRKATAETHRFWRKIHQTTQFRARKCLLGVAKPISKVWTPIFPKKTRQFAPHFDGT